MKTYYKGFLIEPAETKLQIVNTKDCDDFLRHADTLKEAVKIIDEIKLK